MTRPAQRIVWLSRYALRLHGILLAGLTLCSAATYVEWTRALHGHAVAWVYVFQWPLFAVLGSAMWWRLLRTESMHGRPAPPARRSQPSSGIPADDPDLLAWQSYLARLHADDPPGGPPA